MHLRRCMSCGHIGCCDNSPNRHATAHFHASAHPIIQSFEPGEDWLWCYVDEVGFEIRDVDSQPVAPLTGYLPALRCGSAKVSTPRPTRMPPSA